MRREKKFEFHPLADIFPLMEGEEFDALVADIKANGLRESIKLYEGMILDGRNRYRACLAAGVYLSHHPIDDMLDVCNETPAAYVISANIHRRHLTAEQKRELILKCADWSKSDRAIAAEMKTNKNTVGRLRKKVEQKATVPTGTVEKRVGKDGKARKQPAKKKHPPVASPEVIRKNILDGIERHRAIARAYKKVLKVASLDQAMREEVSAAIGGLITVWQSLQRALTADAAPIAQKAATEQAA